MNFQDAASAAQAAAESAKNAVAAAQVAAKLAHQTASNNPSVNRMNPEDSLGNHGLNYRSQSSRASNNYSSNIDVNLDDAGDMDYNIRRHSYNVHRTHTDIKFDESDCDEDNEVEQHDSNEMRQKQSNVKFGNPASVHPKLPDYNALAARFEALKYHKS